MNDDPYPEPYTPQPAPPADPFTTSPDRTGDRSTGRIVFGVIILAIGIFWLLNALNVDLDVPWAAVFAGALIVTGFALVFLAPTGNRAGLVGLGIALSILLGFMSTVEAIGDISFAGGIGEKTEAPATVNDAGGPFRLGIGDLEVDLRGVPFPEGVTEVAASVGIGHMVIIVPSDVSIEAKASAGAGEIVILGDSQDGVDVDWNFDEGAGMKRVLLDISVGLGQIEVER